MTGVELINYQRQISPDLSLLTPSYAFVPRYLSGDSAWTSHIPFAYDLVRALRPALFVELGTWSGDSFFAFCQSVADHALPTHCYAIDHWKGDDQAGRPDENQFSRVQAYCSAIYPEFAYLMRTDFATAAQEFCDETIDLLHIDGAHNYEAVSADFATWSPKVRPGGLILFHDICVRSSEDYRDFGVWKFWHELKGQFRTFEFRHGLGLGILLKGENEDIANWLARVTETTLNAYYARRGADMASAVISAKDLKQKEALAANERDALRNERDDLSREQENLRRDLDAAYRQVEKASERIAQLDSDVEHLKITRFEAKRECHRMRTSLSWRATWPLRVLRDKSAAVLNELKRRGHLSSAPPMQVSSTADEPIAAVEAPERQRRGSNGDAGQGR